MISQERSGTIFNFNNKTLQAYSGFWLMSDLPARVHEEPVSVLGPQKRTKEPGGNGR